MSADPFFYYRNRVPYINNYMFSIQRQITSSTLLTVSYVGNQGHHILAVASVNLGNPALCLSLPGCGPFGEDTTYTNATGQIIYGTRTGQSSIGPLVGTGAKLRREHLPTAPSPTPTTTRSKPRFAISAAARSFCSSYTYAKSIDQGSNLGEQLNPI